MNSTCGRPRATSTLLALALACAMLAQPGRAQAPATPAAAATPAVPAAPLVLPKPDCGAKPEHPGRLGSDARVRQWRKEASAYLECFKKYAMDQRAVAQQYAEAANALIDEYNAAVKEMQAAADAAAN